MAQNESFAFIMFNKYLRCPYCKEEVSEERQGERLTGYACRACSAAFAVVLGYPDFRTNISALKDAYNHWRKTQKIYERNVLRYDIEQAMVNDSANAEIYKRFPVSGKILDIGGGEGFLRKYLSAGDEYLCIDPWPSAVQHAFELSKDERFLKLYSFLPSPYAFLISYGERLPLAGEVFDWVHIRSVLDHTADPPAVLNESKRVLKVGGKLLINLTLSDGPAVTRSKNLSLSKRVCKRLRSDGIYGVLKKSFYALRGADIDHMDHPMSKDLMKMVEDAGFQIAEFLWLSGFTGFQGDSLLIAQK